MTPECEPVVQEMARLHNYGVNIYDLLRMPETSIFEGEEKVRSHVG